MSRFKNIYICKDCGLRTQRSDNLIHSNKEEIEVKCMFCGKVLATKENPNPNFMATSNAGTYIIEEFRYIASGTFPGK